MDERTSGGQASRGPLGMRLAVMTRVGLQMMLHDKPKLVGTVTGVVFAVVLAVQQLSILFGLLEKNTMFVDHAGADIWIGPPGTQQLQAGAPLDQSVWVRARTTPGVRAAEPLVFAQATVKKPGGGTEAVTLVGTALPERLGGPWNVVAGDPAALSEPDTMFFEDADRKKLGGLDLGSLREVGGILVRVGGFTWGLLPFGPSYAFAEVDLARDLARVASNQAQFVLVALEPGADALGVRDALAARIPEAKVLERREFMAAIVSTLLREQLGVSFGVSTAFGLVIGFVIVALSMFSAVLDNLREFGTLKAIGCTTGELSLLLLAQSVAFAVMGSLLGLGLVFQMVEGIRSPQLVPVVPRELVWIVPLAMIGMCVLASGLALLRVRKLEPGMVFR